MEHKDKCGYWTIILYGTLLRKNSPGKEIPCPADHRTGLMSKIGGQRIQAKGGQTARAATPINKFVIPKENFANHLTFPKYDNTTAVITKINKAI